MRFIMGETRKRMAKHFGTTFVHKKPLTLTHQGEMTLLKPQQRQYSSTGNTSHKAMNLLLGPSSGGQRSSKDQDKPYTNFFTRKTLLTLVAAGVGLYELKKALRENFRSDVIQNTILTNQAESDTTQPLFIIDAHALSLAGNAVCAGRSGTKKYLHIDPETGKQQFFYRKKTHTKDGLIKELVLGRLAHLLMGSDFPEVFAAETELGNGQSSFEFLSQSIGHDSVYHDNLEDWSMGYYNDNELMRYEPTNLGVAIAFDSMMGKTDTKLANLVTVRDPLYPCYTIDHESGLRLAPEFKTTTADLMNSIAEFKIKQTSDRFGDALHEGNDINCGTFSVNDEDINVPLRSKPVILKHVHDAIEHAIAQDVESGAVIDMYKRFATMDRTLLEEIPRSFGSLLTPEEQQNYTTQLIDRQQKCLSFTQSLEHRPQERSNASQSSRPPV